MASDQVIILHKLVNGVLTADEQLDVSRWSVQFANTCMANHTEHLLTGKRTEKCSVCAFLTRCGVIDASLGESVRLLDTALHTMCVRMHVNWTMLCILGGLLLHLYTSSVDARFEAWFLQPGDLVHHYMISSDCLYEHDGPMFALRHASAQLTEHTHGNNGNGSGDIMVESDEESLEMELSDIEEGGQAGQRKIASTQTNGARLIECITSMINRSDVSPGRCEEMAYTVMGGKVRTAIMHIPYSVMLGEGSITERNNVWKCGNTNQEQPDEMFDHLYDIYKFLDRDKDREYAAGGDGMLGREELNGRRSDKVPALINESYEWMAYLAICTKKRVTSIQRVVLLCSPNKGIQTKMPPKSTRIHRQYQQSALENAVRIVNGGKMSLTKAAVHFKVPKTTLHDHVTGKIKPRAKLGRPTVSPKETEAGHVAMPRNLTITPKNDIQSNERHPEVLPSPKTLAPSQDANTQPPNVAPRPLANKRTPPTSLCSPATHPIAMLFPDCTLCLWSVNIYSRVVVEELREKAIEYAGNERPNAGAFWECVDAWYERHNISKLAPNLTKEDCVAHFTTNLLCRFNYQRSQSGLYDPKIISQLVDAYPSRKVTLVAEKEVDPGEGKSNIVYWCYNAFYSFLTVQLAKLLNLPLVGKNGRLVYSVLKRHTDSFISKWHID